MKGFVVGINMKDFDSIMAKHADLRTLFGNPYNSCFQWVVQSILEDEESGEDKIAFFHEENDFSSEAHAIFKWFKKYTTASDRLLSLTFGSKKDYVPLQAGRRFGV